MFPALPLECYPVAHVHWGLDTYFKLISSPTSQAKFELIVSEASYLRSLHVAVDHFQLSAPLRATLSNQEYQWLFSRLQDVREVSTT